MLLSLVRLSAHAAEIFPLMSLQGEVIIDTNPDDVPQPGYSHDWDAHGGAAWLHQHLVRNYSGCWQQALPNGEIDPSVCNLGSSRFVNYYVEGLAYAMTNAPHIGGVYYDGRWTTYVYIPDFQSTLLVH
jgi:hypothetical protein